MLLALWRTVHDGRSFVVLLATGLLTLFITAMALLSRRNYASAGRSVTACIWPAGSAP